MTPPSSTRRCGAPSRNRCGWPRWSTICCCSRGSTRGDRSARAPVDLGVLGVDAAADARVVAPDRVVAAEVTEGVTVDGDEDRLRQVLGNLVGNALEHTPAGTAVSVRVHNGGGRAVVEVHDDGPGMTEELAARRVRALLARRRVTFAPPRWCRPRPRDRAGHRRRPRRRRSACPAVRARERRCGSSCRARRRTSVTEWPSTRPGWSSACGSSPGPRRTSPIVTRPTASASPTRPTGRARTEELRLELDELHDRLWAEARRSVVLVLQGMDASGKDGDDPPGAHRAQPAGLLGHELQGAPPTSTSRTTTSGGSTPPMPARGILGVWNRSHYEDVVAARVIGVVDDDTVQPALPPHPRVRADAARRGHHDGQGVPPPLQGRAAGPSPGPDRRPDEELEVPSGATSTIRAHWDEYQERYEERDHRTTSTDWSPWYVVPADHKWVRDVAVAVGAGRRASSASTPRSRPGGGSRRPDRRVVRPFSQPTGLRRRSIGHNGSLDGRRVA